MKCNLNEINEGWHSLVKNLCNYIENVKSEEEIEIEVVQIKQKYGGLRFYVQGEVPDKVYQIIEFAQFMSFKICEYCGSTKEVTTEPTESSPGYIITLCEDCRDKIDEEINERMRKERK